MTPPTPIEDGHGQAIAHLLPPTAPQVPVVVSVPHAGERISPEVEALLADAPEGLRHEMLQDVDRFVDRLWARAPAMGAPTLVARMHRYVLDLNRAPDAYGPDVVEGAPVRDGHYDGRGLIWSHTTRRTPVWRRRLTPVELAARLDRYHTPYHRALAELLDQTRARFGRVVLIDAHSMPSVGRASHGDPGRPRPQINPGVAGGTSCHRAVLAAVEGALAAADLESRTDDPYTGGWITRHYGHPELGVHAIQIEVNRALYMDEETCRPDDARIEALGPLLTGIIPSVVEALARLEDNAR